MPAINFENIASPPDVLAKHAPTPPAHHYKGCPPRRKRCGCRAAAGGPGITRDLAFERINIPTHIVTFLASINRAIASGDLRPDTEPDDIVRALVGIFHTTVHPGWEPSARRLVDILVAGSSSPARRPGGGYLPE